MLGTMVSRVGLAALIVLAAVALALANRGIGFLLWTLQPLAIGFVAGFVCCLVLTAALPSGKEH
jgi:hypothetical protein